MTSVVRAGLFVVAVAIFVVSPAGAQNVSDETAPTVTRASLSPTSINTNSGPQNLTITLDVADDLSGVNYAYVYLRTTATGQTGNSTSLSCYVGQLATGTRLDGTLTGTCPFPQYSQTGTWFAYDIYVYDGVGNYRRYFENSNQLSIAPDTLSVTAPTRPASAPPDLLSFAITPDNVDTTASAQTVTLDVRVTTTEGTFNYGLVQLSDPTFNQYLTLYFYPWNRVSGDGNDGVYRASATLPQYSRSGAWVWRSGYVYNSQSFYNSYSGPQNGAFRYRSRYDGVNSTFTDLGTSGPTYAPLTLDVTSTPDITPPTLISLDISPASIDVSTSFKYVNFTIAATDDLSGWYYGCVSFVSPNGQQHRSGCVVPPGASRTGSIFFPQYSQAGNWSVEYLYLYDNSGNGRFLYPADLVAGGFSTSLQISSGVEVRAPLGK